MKWEVRRGWHHDSTKALRPTTRRKPCGLRPDQSPAAYNQTKAQKHNVQTKEAPRLDQSAEAPRLGQSVEAEF